MGRLEDAKVENKKGLIGGISEIETHDYFVSTYCASVARTEYMLLDPHDEIGEIAEELLDSFTDGRIRILDIPCGSGGSILGMLSCLYQLRKEGHISRLPLDVSILAGDISEPARILYDDMLSEAAIWLAVQGIRISWECQAWDVTDTASTAALVDAWFDQGESEEWVVIIAAISGFLSKSKKDFDHNKRFFQHITERMHDRLGSVTWVEPQSNDSLWLFNKIVSLSKSGRWVAKLFNDVRRFTWHHPIKNSTFSGGIRVFDYKKTSNL